MKQVLTVMAALALTISAVAQSATELTFRNPVKVEGTERQLNAVYRFYNVANGVDALLTIAGASHEAQLVNNIDLTTYGWDKAFQPEIGRTGNRTNESWWVRFNLKFVYPNTSTKRKLSKFYATAIDVDGDAHTIREFIQMYGADSVKYRTETQLTQAACFNAGLATNSKTNHTRGPINNFVNIDTTGTQVMVTYTFLNTDEIDFVYGATVGSGTSNAGLRLNSLWFRAFNLNNGGTLPFRNEDFSVLYDKKNVNLQWKATAQDGVSSFVVERSEDGRNFTDLTDVTFTSRNNQYSYTDVAPASATGVLHYRLRYKELNGEARYSATKLVHLKKDGVSMSLYPNPVQSSANLTIPAAWQTKAVVVSVFNTAGNLVKTLSIRAASQTETLDFANLSRGMYVVKAQCEGASAEQRIIKN